MRSYPLYRIVQPAYGGFELCVHEASNLEAALKARRHLHATYCRYKDLPYIEVHAGLGKYERLKP